MKRFLIALLILSPIAVFAQNPFIGEWKVDLIGQKDGYHWSIKDDGTIDTVSKTGPSVLNYDLDTDKKEITISSETSEPLRLRYVLSGDKFTFYLLDVVNSPYYDDFKNSFGGAWDKLKGVNSITDDAVEYLKKQLNVMLEGLPMMRGVRDRSIH